MKQSPSELVRIRCFGGFEVRLGEHVVTGFESQKARALLAYLFCNRDRSFGREYLAGMLWPEKPDAAARHALRQAVYSLRSTLAKQPGSPAPLLTDHTSVGVDPEFGFWLDQIAYEQAIRRSTTEDGGCEPQELVKAVQLYRGDFLADFSIRDSPAFEEWLLGEQERLRESMLFALRQLVENYLTRGEFRLGIHYARQLVAIDPYSEDGHRQLMRLLACSSRRSRALAQYEQLRNLLNVELGVEPLEETTELYRSLLRDETPEVAERPGPEPLAPLIPLVGRSEEFLSLRESWSAVLAGAGRLTLVEGSAGVGKSRLVKSFLDSATSRQRAVVLTGSNYPAAPTVPYEPFRELLMGAFLDVLPEEPEVLPRVAAASVADLLLVVPDLRSKEPALGLPERLPKPRPERLGNSLVELLTTIVHRYEPGASTPVACFIEDAHWADAASLDLLWQVAERTAALPIWLLATRRPGGDSGSHPLLQPDPPAPGATPVEVIRLSGLDLPQVEELARGVVGLAEAPELAAFLWEHGQGQPLKVAELINYLWDERVLSPVRQTHWQLDIDTLRVLSPPAELGELIHQRLQRLPDSARRLIAVAAALGQQFDVDSLRLAANEHLSVVEICLEMMLERWLIRQHPRSWSQTGRQKDLVLWARGARRGWFEFGHKAIRDAVLAHVNPLRRQHIHREIGQVLRQRYGEELDRLSERLAYHDLAGGELARALPALETSREKAERSGATEVASWYLERSLQAIDRLLKSARGESERERLVALRERLESHIPGGAKRLAGRS